mgnify:CR=1 FL=1
MTNEELKEILELHRKWLFNIDGGKRADLSYADLRSADLSYADLRSADLSSANLSSADLSYANLRSADLSSANLSSAKTDKRYIQISCIGSRKDITTYCFEDDLIICGCFKGTLKEFNKKVLESYPDEKSQHHKEYIGAIKYLEGLR